NFLEAEMSANGGPPIVRLSGGEFPFVGGGAGELADKPLVLGIRAENIEVHKEPGEGRIRATVLVLEPLGSHNLLTVRSGNDTLKVAARADLFPSVDSEVWLKIEPERIRWMDRTKRKALDIPALSSGAPST